MTQNEAASFLGDTVENVKRMTEEGAELPVSKKLVILKKTTIHGEISISDEDLDAFIQLFEDEEPGRNPPTEVRRKLMVESKHLCAICRQRVTRLAFHHILEWAKIKHHDPTKMLAVCGTCHDDCGIGKIDKKAQWEYKARLKHVEYTAAAASPDAEKVKRQRDIEVLTRLMSQLHTTFTNRFLNEAAYGYVYYDFMGHFWEGFDAVVKAPDFYLYDSTLRQLISDFHFDVEKVLSFGKWMSFVATMQKLKWDESHITDPAWHTDLDEFQKYAVLSDGAYRSLFAYIKEQYIEIDFKATDDAAWKDFLSYRTTEPEETELKKSTMEGGN